MCRHNNNFILVNIIRPYMARGMNYSAMLNKLKPCHLYQPCTTRVVFEQYSPAWS